MGRRDREVATRLAAETATLKSELTLLKSQVGTAGLGWPQPRSGAYCPTLSSPSLEGEGTGWVPRC
jgi:hypothetical protein